MVCDRCIRVVNDEIKKIGLGVEHIQLGEVVVTGDVDGKKEIVRQALEANGFELIDDKKAKLVEQLKILIVDLVHHKNNSEKELRRYTTYLARKMGYDYHYLSKLFSSIENLTIEQYVIMQKIERVKELLVYDELTLSEIAYSLAYGSVQHLSHLFKQVTGFTPTEFKKIKTQKRKSIDTINSAM